MAELPSLISKNDITTFLADKEAILAGFIEESNNIGTPSLLEIKKAEESEENRNLSKFMNITMDDFQTLTKGDLSDMTKNLEKEIGKKEEPKKELKIEEKKVELKEVVKEEIQEELKEEPQQESQTLLEVEKEKPEPKIKTPLTAKIKSLDEFSIEKRSFFKEHKAVIITFVVSFFVFFVFIGLFLYKLGKPKPDDFPTNDVVFPATEVLSFEADFIPIKSEDFKSIIPEEDFEKKAKEESRIKILEKLTDISQKQSTFHIKNIIVFPKIQNHKKVIYIKVSVEIHTIEYFEVFIRKKESYFIDLIYDVIYKETETKGEAVAPQNEIADKILKKLNEDFTINTDKELNKAGKELKSKAISSLTFTEFEIVRK